MPRWIAFDGAPTVKLLLETVDATSSPCSAWQTFTFRLAPPSSPRSTSKGVRAGQDEGRRGTADDGRTGGQQGAGEPAQVWDVTSSQFADADISRRGDEAEAVPPSETDEDTLLRVRKRPRRRSTPSQESSEPVKEEARDDFEGESRMSVMLPPLTQRRRRSTLFPPTQTANDITTSTLPPTAPLPDITAASTNCYGDDSYAATQSIGGISLGPPPQFSWHVHQLVPLDQLRGRLANQKKRYAKFSVLTCVLTFDKRDTKAGSLTEVVLVDSTGQTATLVLWKESGDEIARAIQRGDVIFVENLAIKEYNGKIQLSFSDRESQLGICWRTHITEDADYDYRFPEAWRHDIPQANAVLREADPTSLAATILRFTSLVRSRLPAQARTVSLPVRRFALPAAPLAMPPKRTSSKRAAVDETTAAKEDKEVQAKAEEDSPLSELSGSEKEAAPKKKRAKKPPVTPLDPSVPTNKEVPEDLSSFPRPPEGCVRISAWNVAGLRASEKKGFSRYVNAEDADILVVTETKTPELSLPALDDRYEYRYWGDHVKKGHAGTAIFSKIKPLNVSKGFQASEEVTAADSEGRMITLEFENSYVVGTYVPNAGNGLKTLPEKEKWNRAFETYLRELDAKKPVIWCGDLNVVPTPTDIRNWKTNYNKSAGCTDAEINGFKAQLNPEEGSGHKRLVDVWREKHPDLEGHYTYYSYKFQCREKGIGWRLDYQVVSERLLPKVKACEIRAEIWGASDHVPIVLDIEGPL
ncbi:DNA-Apurinic or apyrimidinic site lyase [Rhodotorula toruloides]